MRLHEIRPAGRGQINAMYCESKRSKVSIFADTYPTAPQDRLKRRTATFLLSRKFWNAEIRFFMFSFPSTRSHEMEDLLSANSTISSVDVQKENTTLEELALGLFRLEDGNSKVESLGALPFSIARKARDILKEAFYLRRKLNLMI
jgi:hypothetical protein